MAKERYKILASIDRSHLDHEITLSAMDMRSKPIPIKVLLYWFAILGVLVWTVLQSPLSGAGWGWKILFILWFLAAAVFYGRQLKTKEFVWSQLPAAVEYSRKSSRKIRTRRSSEPYGFMEVLGIRDIEDNGLIHFLDGSVGQTYSVVGSASRLLFDQDRGAIIDRVDNFWRKVDTSSEWIFIDTQEPQRVTPQVAALHKRNEALKASGKFHPELFELAQEQYEILTKDVGGKFTSIHQYLIIKSPSMLLLKSAHELLSSEVSNSTMMFKRCMMLDAKMTYRALGPIYGSYALRNRELEAAKA